MERRAILLTNHHNLRGTSLAIVEDERADVGRKLTIVHIYILGLGLDPLSHLRGVVGRAVETKPTCSEYAILVLQKYGVIRGTWKIYVRLFKTC
ncbi:MAG: membrane protein insertion efficiency factor YidD, partial [Alistipes sp.]|nr:membrane protein insertion efficiency factor YidD [Alistipes sp.]